MRSETVTKKHRNNGPTFAHSTIKKTRQQMRPPAQRQAATEQAARDAEKQKVFRQRLKKDPIGLIEEHLGPIKEYLKKNS
jgi:hypothetical protein